MLPSAEKPWFTAASKKEQTSQQNSQKWSFNATVRCGYINCKSLYCLYQHSIKRNLKSQQPSPCANCSDRYLAAPLLTEVLDLLGSCKYREWLLRASKRKGIFKIKKYIYGHLIASHLSCLSAVLKEMTSLSKYLAAIYGAQSPCEWLRFPLRFFSLISFSLALLRSRPAVQLLLSG